MSCVVGVVAEDGVVVVGSDSAAVSGNSITIRKDPKVFFLKQSVRKAGALFVRENQALVGFVGSFRYGQLLRSLVLPIDGSDPNDHDAHFIYLVNEVIPEIRKLLKEDFTVADVARTSSSFLIAYRGWIYGVGSDLHVIYAGDPCLAIGSGGSCALGALSYAYRYTKFRRLSAVRLVERALRVSQERCHTVRGPMQIMVLGDS